MNDECKQSGHDWRYNHQVMMLTAAGEAAAYQVYVCRRCDESDYREIR